MTDVADADSNSGERVVVIHYGKGEPLLRVALAEVTAAPT